MSRAKPAEIRLLEGNPGHRPIPDVVKPRPVVDAKPPRWMSREAKAEWRRIVPELEAVGLLTSVDHALLEAYCATYDRWLEAHQLAKLEVTITEKGYPVVDPMIGVEQKLLSQLKSLAAEFGMSPSARTRIHVGTSERESEMDELLSGPRLDERAG